MIVENYYLSEHAEQVCEITELSMDELETMVGRFNKNSHRAGKLRGELIIKINGDMIIRHHFNTSKKYWSNKWTQRKQKC